ncbi:MAG: GNAT family N-acetyltransferase [Synechococcales cyanobacterium]
MSFWKTWFNSTTPTSTTKTQNGTAIHPIRTTPQGDQIYCTNERDLDLYELEELCDAVGWARRPIHKVKKALTHSFIVVAMWKQRGSYRRLIGFARATSDHTFNATIWDVVVHPEFQNQGLGKALMDRVIRDLRAQDISNVTLFADRGVIDFYRRLGFTPDPEGIKGMFWYPDHFA